jgi:hypothetical protein
MQKYTVIWEDRWQSGSHHHCLTKRTWVEANSIEDVMEKYGEYARYIFEGHQLSIGESLGSEEIDIIKN